LGFILTLTLQTNFGGHLQAATNLAASPVAWIDLTNCTATSSSLTFTDREAANCRLRFYRAACRNQGNGCGSAGPGTPGPKMTFLSFDNPANLGKLASN
jgi:hypothetical protein